ncbi:unnamed protein product [Cylicocyclus nassatus]|uniref:Uncharacterized protein n=1 Tax=Cylicocyclus nassatus TaxID=53992 RepID=A0AA36DLC4_CYLNA|nr:unnamed protein product [Cylicocyclus nassatus]
MPDFGWRYACIPSRWAKKMVCERVNKDNFLYKTVHKNLTCEKNCGTMLQMKENLGK